MKVKFPLSSDVHPYFMPLLLGVNTYAKYIAVDLSNGSFGKGYYVWGFDTRDKARKHVRLQNSDPNNARLSEVIKLRTYEQTELVAPGFMSRRTDLIYGHQLNEATKADWRLQKLPVLQYPLHYSGGWGCAFETAQDFVSVLRRYNTVPDFRRIKTDKDGGK